MDRWHGKVAVVTGAASGIGAAIAARLRNEGINVVGIDLQLEKLQEQAADRKTSEVGALYPLECDVSRGDDIERAFEWIANNLGCVHIMINNAGITNYTPVTESDRASFERLININVLAMATCTLKAVRIMRANNVEGHIVNICSVLGCNIPEGTPSDGLGANGWNLYPASKHAAVAMTRTVRREISRLGAPIRVTAINPGFVNTDISKHNKTLENIFKKIPSLNPDDIADALVYVLGTRPDVQISEITVQKRGELI